MKCPYCKSIRLLHCYSYVETAYNMKCADCKKYFNREDKVK